MERFLRGIAGTLVWCAGLTAAGAALAATTTHLPTPAGGGRAFHCDVHRCAVPDRGAYPYLVIGRYAAHASAAQSARLFHAMRVRGLWQALPVSAESFYKALQPVSIRLADGSVLAVLMARQEFRDGRPQPGDLVRYSPHRGKFEIPPADPAAKAYWSVDGCVAILCRKSDLACFKRYPAGVYRPSDGVAISPRSFRALPHHVVINPDTLLPVAPVRK